MTKKITDLEGRLMAALKRADKPRKKAPLPMPGSGDICPRCTGPKPVGDVGRGIALSRRGRVAICADCGTEEALLDAKIMHLDREQFRREERIVSIVGESHASTHTKHSGGR